MSDNKPERVYRSMEEIEAALFPERIEAARIAKIKADPKKLAAMILDDAMRRLREEDESAVPPKES